MTDPTAHTFETGYARLQSIGERVTSQDVPVAEMCDLFAEGKGLQHALTEYLDEQKGRVEATERGEGIQAFRIVAPTRASDTEDSFGGPPASTGPSPSSDFIPPASGRGSDPADDDIPF